MNSSSLEVPTPLPSEVTKPTHSLPLWIVPLLLVGLTVIGGLIVLMGWLVMKPPAPVAVESKPFVKLVDALAEAKAPTLPGSPVILDEEPIDLPTKPQQETRHLQWRMPTGVADLELPSIAPKHLAEPKIEAGPKLNAMLQWTLESPGTDTMDLIMPIEVAKKEDAAIPHSVRRLQRTEQPTTQRKLAVTPVVHDDMGSVLTRMGEGYRFTTLRNEDVLSFESLKKYDVVFLTCADLYAKDFQAAVPLRKFVANGGTLYASDLRGDLLQTAFPEFRARVPILPGVPQIIEASVAEPGLRAYLGRKAIPLRFEAPDWRPAAFDPSRVTVCLKGTYRNNLGQALSVPLLVKFRFQKGTVIFTSFHHVKNDGEVVRKLLEYLVFSTVNARSEAVVKDLMQRTQFTPSDLRPALINAGSSIHASYQHAGGRLQIAVAFEDLDAQLKLTLRSPSGQLIEHIDRGLFAIEIPNAEPGAWHYSITPLELPYENFPITMAIGAAKS